MNINLIKKPWISEKASGLSRFNQYVFIVDKNANKVEIKRVIENIYKVNVVKVRMVRHKGKIKRLGRTTGRKSDYKKAVISLREGQTIDILPH